MRTNLAAQPWRTSLAWSAVNRAAGWSIFGIIAWFWLFSAAGPAWRAVSLVAVEVLAALAGVAWFLPRARAKRQWRAALDRYAERKQASKARPRSEAAWAWVIDTDNVHAAGGGIATR